MYTVRVGKRAMKKIAKAPESVQLLFDELIEDLEAGGPIRTEWLS
jgi:mRNA-degrading endonuclease RelE of RelBE toxin-antitoxin system